MQIELLPARPMDTELVHFGVCQQIISLRTIDTDCHAALSQFDKNRSLGLVLREKKSTATKCTLISVYVMAAKKKTLLQRSNFFKSDVVWRFTVSIVSYP